MIIHLSLIRKKYCKDILRKIFRRPIPRFGLVDRHDGIDGFVNFCLDTPDEFYIKAQKFVASYFEMLGNTEDKLLVVDQIIQPHI